MEIISSGIPHLIGPNLYLFYKRIRASTMASRAANAVSLSSKIYVASSKSI